MSRGSLFFVALALGLLVLGATVGGLPLASGSLGPGMTSPGTLIRTAGSSPNGSAPADPSGSTGGITCPSAAINVSGMSFNCVTELELTEVVVILLTVMITLYVFRDADRAELPGEAEEIPVTAEEELDYRLRLEAEHAADREAMGPAGGSREEKP